MNKMRWILINLRWNLIKYIQFDGFINDVMFYFYLVAVMVGITGFATWNLLLIFKGRSGRKGRKGTFLALCFFPWAGVEISRVSRARRVRKQATIKFD